MIDVETLYDIYGVFIKVMHIITFYIWIPALIIWVILVNFKKFKKYKKLGKWLVCILPVWFVITFLIGLLFYMYFDHVWYILPSSGNHPCTYGEYC